MIHYSKTAGNPCGRILYYTLRNSYYYPSLAIDFNSTVHSWDEFSLEIFNLLNLSTKMKLFSATEPLSLVSIYIFGELIRTKSGKSLLLVIITHPITNFTRTVV